MVNEVIEIDGESYVVGWHVEEHSHIENFELADVIETIRNASPEPSRDNPEYLIYIHSGLCVVVSEDSEYGLHVIVSAYRVK